MIKPQAKVLAEARGIACVAVHDDELRSIESDILRLFRGRPRTPGARDGRRGSILAVSDERLPIEQVLPGFGLHPLEDGWTPISAFVLVKSLDSDGVSSWSFRTSESLNLEELLGALTVQVDVLKQRLVDEWSAPEE